MAFDIADLDVSFVETNRGISSSVIDSYALNARHFANPLFHSVYA